ncbi:synaptotagmin-14-like isoform X2 [Anguilla anguilla]|uniref:synaptotagmin-14-like isoform X2 n=1 Tax=Anguilla anguilla TaxID=7936 RepID=UPI0015B1A704|nr:synaptotagmin-14-like isoform X2 [Anguilla anguilla]
MAFFRSFQQSLPSVSSILDSVSTAVDDLASAVGDATYTVSDQLVEQVSTIMNKAQTEEEEKEEETAGRAKEAYGRTGGRRAEEDRSRDHGTRPARSAEASAKSDRYQSPGEGIREEGCRKKNTRKVEEGKAKAGGRRDMLVEEGSSHSSPKGKSRKCRDGSGEDSTSPLHSRAAGGRSQKAQGETTSSSTDRATRKDNLIPNGAAINGDCQRDTPEESPPPYSKPGKDRIGRQTKANVKERMEEEKSQEKEMVFDTAQTPKETGALEEESKSPKSGKEKEDTKKAARARKSQKESSGKNSKICRDGTKKERSRENTGKDGDLWESSSESDSEKTKKPAESVSVCHSQAATRGPDSQSQHSYGWETQQKYSPHSAQCGGYSSEASTEEANCIQRISRGHALEEQRPPPYQDERGGSRRSPRQPTDARRGNREPSRRSAPAKRRSHGGGRASDGSDEREPEGHQKGQEEDVPSDSTAVLGPEDMSAHGSALLLSKGYEPEPLAKYGTLDVAFDYDSGEQRLAVTVTAATDIPALRRTGNVSWQVHLVLLPTKQQRAKTGVQKGPCPVFTETFKFTCVESETIGSYAVRFRLYSVRRMRKERVMGEKVFYLTKLNLQGKMSVPVTLDPGCTLKGCGSLKSVSCSEGVSSYRSAGQTSRPEILLGLLYSSTTGRLSVEVIKGSHFRDMAPGKPPTLSDGLFCCLKHLIGGQLYIIPDTYVKLTMMNSMGQEMSKCKTSTCRGRPDPTYKETFAFQVALFQLSEVTLLLSVYCRRGVKRRDRVGWVSLGLNSSGEAETSHWAQMREAEGQQVCRWLTLLDS